MTARPVPAGYSRDRLAGYFEGCGVVQVTFGLMPT